MASGRGLAGFVSGLSYGARTAHDIAQTHRANRLEDEETTRRRTREDYEFERQKMADQREDSIRGAYQKAADVTDKSLGRGLGDAVGAGASPKPMSVDEYMDAYMKNGVPVLVQAYIQNGEPEKAQAFQTWMESDGAKKGLKAWSNAVSAAQIGDERKFVDSIIETYNTRGYFDDGYSAIREKSGLRKDDAGNVVGAAITLRDEETGEEFEQNFDGIEDVYAYGVAMLEPAQVFEFGMGEIAKEDQRAAAEAESARAFEKEDRMQANKIELENVKQTHKLALERWKQTNSGEVLKPFGQNKGDRGLVQNVLKTLQETSQFSIPPEGETRFIDKDMNEQIAIATEMAKGMTDQVVQAGIPKQRQLPPDWRP